MFYFPQMETRVCLTTAVSCEQRAAPQLSWDTDRQEHELLSKSFPSDWRPAAQLLFVRSGSPMSHHRCPTKTLAVHLCSVAIRWPITILPPLINLVEAIQCNCQ